MIECSVSSHDNLSWLFVQPPSELHKLGLSRSEKECRNYRKKQNKQQHTASRIMQILKIYGYSIGYQNIEFDIALQFLSTTFTPQGPLCCWTRFFFVFLVIDRIFGSPQIGGNSGGGRYSVYLRVPLMLVKIVDGPDTTTRCF